MSLQPDPACKCCGVPWTRHLGISGTCAELQRARGEAERMRVALRTALLEVMDHPLFDEAMFEARDIKALCKVGGDICAWTGLAITLADALEGKQ